MRFTALRLRGLRQGDFVEVRLDPVTVWVGPNGSGKTSAVGAAAYALTGRFPGVIGVTAGDLIGLAADPRAGFEVELEGVTPGGEIVRVTRGVDREEVGYLKVMSGEQRSRGPDSAKALLASLVGDVAWFADAFDPERSVWRLSSEKRKEWMLGLCAGASGWSKTRLIEELGAPNEDWDPSVSPDPAICLDVNLDRLKVRVLAAQRVVREANVIADGVSVTPAIETKLVVAEQAYETAREVVLVKDRLREQAQQQVLAAAKVERDRVQWTEQIARARAAAAKMTPPAPPAEPPSLEERETKEADLFAAELEREEAGAAFSKLEFAAQVARAEATRRRDEFAEVVRDRRCHACEAPNPDVRAFRQRAETADSQATELERRLATVTARGQVATNGARADALLSELANLDFAREIYAHDLATYQARQAEFETTWQTALTAVSALETQLAALPAARPPVDLTPLDVGIAQARATEATLKAELNSFRAAVGVARERMGQMQAAQQATTRAAELKERLEKMRAVRDRMLDDAVDPLRAALCELGALAHDGGGWEIRRDEREVEIGWVKGKTFLPAASLSTGEKYRATLALLIARAMVRREPWVGIFADNMEVIYPPPERDAVLVALAQSAHAGFVDNVFVAGACERPRSAYVLVYELER